MSLKKSILKNSLAIGKNITLFPLELTLRYAKFPLAITAAATIPQEIGDYFGSNYIEGLAHGLNPQTYIETYTRLKTLGTNLLTDL